jgi:hypothetical protein
MSAAVMMGRIQGVSPRFKARLAGGLYFFTLLTAQLLETLLGGKAALAAGLIEITGMALVTLVLYEVFRPVERTLSLLAAAFNFVGITLEAMRLSAHGSGIALVFHGFFCILIGYLIFKSTFLPRTLAALMAIGSLGWMTFLFPPLASYLSPWNLVCGLAGEASVFGWLAVMGVNVQRWEEQASAAPIRE